VLRDEMLGLSQRSALLEENLAKLADSANQGRQAVQRDEAELLLTQAAQRLNYADDVEGARRLYAQAATALADLPDSDGLNLRQALVQERDALDALGSRPARAVAAAPGCCGQGTAGPAFADHRHDRSAPPPPWWQATLAPFVDITPSRQNGPLTAAEQRNADDALQLELTWHVPRSSAATARAAIPHWTAWSTGHSGAGRIHRPCARNVLN
jgi:uroporphyrin-3 C-methyltransferase